MIALLAAWALQSQSPAREIQFTVPPGFVVDRPSDVIGSFLALAFDPDGYVYLGRESDGLVGIDDREGDGVFELIELLTPDLVQVQGLCCPLEPGRSEPSALWAVGSRRGQNGIWRVPLEGGTPKGEPELRLEFSAGGEHGPHALVAGPDGFIYAVVGNQAAFRSEAAGRRELWSGDEGRLLAPYRDPLGYGTEVRYPGGFVARLDLARRTWHYVAVGLRNVYDVAFDERGSLFGVDSDMEWDLGLPWYRPVRLLRLRDGADFGSRTGSGVIPAWCADTGPGLLELGRGSPTGAVFGARARFPEPWRSALFSGDWSQGRILALWTGGDGAQSSPRSEVFLSADAALPVTDLEVGPDGALWFLTGGRGAKGGVFRVRYAGEASAPTAERAAAKETAQASRLEQDIRALGTGRAPAPASPVREALRGFERESWPLALRIAASSWPLEEIEAAARSTDLGERTAALFLLAPIAAVPGRADRIAAFALELLAEATRVEARREEWKLAALRGLELGLLRQGDPAPALREELAARLLALLPDAEPRVSGEVAALLAHLDDPRALEPLLARMEECPQEPAIHYADCIHRMTRGWDAQNRARMLAWFARSNAYQGGASLPGYLSAMRAKFVSALPPEACAELARAEGLDAESLALLLARLPSEQAAELFARFEQALARLVPRAYGTAEQSAKDAALRAIAAIDSAAVQELARTLARTEGALLEEPWVLLARTPEEKDFELWLTALVMPSIGKRECALRALSKLAAAPATAEAWRSLLDHAHELGPKRGRELMRMLGAWCARAGGTAPETDPTTPELFESARLALEAWYAAKFPQGRGPMEPGAQPRWNEAQIAAFLGRVSPRPGSADHGRLAFESAGCGACHAVGAASATDRRGFGPDLAHVAERMSDAEILAAIVAPSRVVSDQYRMSIAITKDERIFEGLVTRRDAQGVELQPVADLPVRIEQDELESLKPSPRSPMPEGALEGRTLEEVRDLFAYLKAGRAEPAARAWAPLFGPGGLAGWDGDSAVWSVRGATLLGRSQGLAQSSYVLAPMPAQDLLVEFDVFLPPGANSGFCYRARRPEDPRRSDPSGAQADLGQAYWGSLYVDGAGTVVKADAAQLSPALDREGWNHVLVRVAGERHAMEINGALTYSVSHAVAEGPLLGFQVHQGAPMQVRIANARWRAP